jgi:hypothetical protein
MRSKLCSIAFSCEPSSTDCTAIHALQDPLPEDVNDRLFSLVRSGDLVWVMSGSTCSASPADAELGNQPGKVEVATTSAPSSQACEPHAASTVVHAKTCTCEPELSLSTAGSCFELVQQIFLQCGFQRIDSQGKDVHTHQCSSDCRTPLPRHAWPCLLLNCILHSQASDSRMCTCLPLTAAPRERPTDRSTDTSTDRSADRSAD